MTRPRVPLVSVQTSRMSEAGPEAIARLPGLVPLGILTGYANAPDHPRPETPPAPPSPQPTATVPSGATVRTGTLPTPEPDSGTATGCHAPPGGPGATRTEAPPSQLPARAPGHV